MKKYKFRKGEEVFILFSYKKYGFLHEYFYKLKLVFSNNLVYEEAEFLEFLKYEFFDFRKNLFQEKLDYFEEMLSIFEQEFILIKQEGNFEKYLIFMKKLSSLLIELKDLRVEIFFIVYEVDSLEIEEISR